MNEDSKQNASISIQVVTAIGILFLVALMYSDRRAKPVEEFIEAGPRFPAPYGVGLCEDLAATQLAHNALLKVVSQIEPGIVVVGAPLPVEDCDAMRRELLPGAVAP